MIEQNIILSFLIFVALVSIVIFVIIMLQRDAHSKMQHEIATQLKSIALDMEAMRNHSNRVESKNNSIEWSIGKMRTEIDVLIDKVEMINDKKGKRTWKIRH